jgi:hypothetical protein
MSKVNQPEDLVARIKRLETEVARLSRGSTLANSVLSQGTMEVRTDTGAVIQQVGAIPWAGTTVYGSAQYRANGTVVSVNWDVPGGGGYFSFYDEQGNGLFANDTVSNQGISRPYLQYTAMPYSEVLTPPQSTTSATFTPLHRCHFQRQQPWVRTWLITQADAATTGEVRLAVAGSAITAAAITAASTAIAAASNAYQVVDAELPGDFLGFSSVDVEARRVSGAGAIRVGVAFVSGRQS